MSRRLYMPAIHAGAAIAGQGEPSPMNRRAALFAAAWMALIGEKANRMVLDDRLCRCAQSHAEYLASRTPEEIAARAHVKAAMHMSRDGRMSNQRVIDAGYKLPDYYPRDRNNVESCARSENDPAQVAINLAAHDTHHDHMMLIGDSFGRQTVWGVGCAGNDYVALTAPAEEI